MISTIKDGTNLKFIKINYVEIKKVSQALARWLRLVAPKKEVVSSTPHAGMVPTTIVHQL